MSKFVTISKNQLGRDFICSDLHGYFNLLEEKLKAVNFNPKCDRLFSLGDMIDRGDDSELAFEYLKKDWFYSILGNHEVMLIEAYESKDQEVKEQWFSWGGNWADGINEEKFKEYYLAMLALPIVIELEIEDGKKIGLVHANLKKDADWNLLRARIQKLREKKFTTLRLLDTLLWSKVGEQSEKKLKKVTGIEHVFHGHTIKDEITTIGNRTYLDLGSYCNQQIGFIEPNEFLNGLGKLISGNEWSDSI